MRVRRYSLLVVVGSFEEVIEDLENDADATLTTGGQGA